MYTHTDIYIYIYTYTHGNIHAHVDHIRIPMCVCRNLYLSPTMYTHNWVVYVINVYICTTIDTYIPLSIYISLFLVVDIFLDVCICVYLVHTVNIRNVKCSAINVSYIITRLSTATCKITRNMPLLNKQCVCVCACVCVRHKNNHNNKSECE